MKHPAAILLLVLSPTCVPQPEPVPPTPVPVQDAAPAPAPKPVPFNPPSGTPCVQACYVLSWIGCTAGPTPKGEACESYLERANKIPGLVDCAGMALCRDIDCARKHGAVCH